MDRVLNDSADLFHLDENADHAADTYAALTGDLECHSRAKVREFWAPILPGDLEDYTRSFFEGFLTAIAAEVS